PRRRSALGRDTTIHALPAMATIDAFGEAIPAQAIAQVCELTWQLRGEAGPRQVDDAHVGLTINYGMFGHGSSVVVRR
ncbi:MAG: lipid-transfer protein, partial [Actinomycetota bacterium]